MTKRTSLFTWLTITACILSIPAAANARTIYVDADGPADFNNIQAAIDDSNDGDTIIVAEGTYDVNEPITYRGKEITVKSEAGPDVTIIRMENLVHGRDSSVVVFESGEGPNSVLEGFTLTGGGGCGCIDDLCGGGIYVYESSPTIKDNIITGNNAYWGGGIMCYSNANPLIMNCTISDNSVYSDGGGICIIYYSNPTITNCVLTSNTGGAAGVGGGLFCEDSNPNVSNCTFSGNSGGGMIYDWSNPTISNCILWDDVGVELYVHGGTAIVTYSNIQGDDLWPGEGNINVSPYFADSDNADYHLKSQAGRYDPNTQTWVQDDETSPCIDAGDPMTPIGSEPFPNGGIINMGAYGGTAEASKSYFGKPPCETIVAGDINGDCEVNFLDFRLMALHWMEGHD